MSESVLDATIANTGQAAGPLLHAPRRCFNIFVLHPSMWLTDHQPSGDGLLAFELLNRLAQRGHRLHVAVSLQSIQGPVPENLHLHDVSTFTKASPYGASAANRVEFGLRAGRLYRQLARTVPFDVAHQLNPVLNGLCFFAGLPLPLIMGPIPPAWPPGTEHRETWSRRLLERIKPICQALQFRYAQTALAANEVAAEHLRAAHVPPGRVQVLPFGVDPAFFTDEDVFGVRQPLPEQPTILFLSNLWRRKGIFTLLEAFSRVRDAVPEARLLIGGSGSDEAEVRAAVEQHSHRAGIEMLGRVARADVPATLRNCTVFCLPSFGEPCGTVAMEAMSCGRALVVTDTGGVSCLLPPGAPWVVPTGDPGALAQALVAALASPAQAERLGRENRAHVLRDYAWTSVLDRLEAIYSSCARTKL